MGVDEFKARLLESFFKLFDVEGDVVHEGGEDLLAAGGVAVVVEAHIVLPGAEAPLGVEELLQGAADIALQVSGDIFNAEFVEKGHTGYLQDKNS